MDQETNLKSIKKLSVQRLLIVVLFVLLTATTVCGLIYWRLDGVIKTQDEQIKMLSNQIDYTSGKIHELSSE